MIATEPDTFAVVEDFRGPIRFDFDERISERVEGGALDDAVLISPNTGDVRVSHDRRSLSIEVDGGFRPGTVYRITLLPVVRDMFNNQLRDPFELVFSTGGEPVATTVAGQVWDRITGRGVADAEVRAVGDDSLTHVARADTGGIYAFRYLPEGRFRVTAFLDRNRDGVVDPMEVQGRRPLLISAGDTLLIDVPVLQPDTTPARLIRASPLDSVTLVIEFDDYLDPGESVERIGVSLSREDGSAPGIARLFHEHEYADFVEQVRDSFARLDSLEAAARRVAQDSAAAAQAAADSAAATRDTVVADTAGVAPAPADSAAAAPDSLPTGDAEPMVPERPRRRLPPMLEGARGSGQQVPQAGRVGRPGQARRSRPGGEPLPAQRVVAVLDAPLEPNVGYQLTVTTVLNINELPLGGGDATVVLEPPPDTTRADTASVEPDSSGVPPDTSGVPPDSGSVARTLFDRLVARR